MGIGDGSDGGMRSNATRARSDKAPVVDTSAPPMVEDASENSWASPRAAQTSFPEREAYVMVDTLMSLMSTMADAIMRQVTEQVKRAVEVAGLTRPVHGEEPSHPSEEMSSLLLAECGREATQG